MMGIFLSLLNCSKEPLAAESSQSLLGKSANKPEIKSDTKAQTYYGPQMSIGNGKVRSWIRICKDGLPEEIGVELNAKALEGLPTSGEHLSMVLPFHIKAKEVTPFDHVYFNWNPAGHEPPGVFDVPHFDVHFTWVSVEEREAIPAWTEGEIDAKFNNYPPPEYLPADYFTPPGAATAEPAMGKHWLPNNLPDLLPFTNVILYGSYDGKVLFEEPMDTWAFLNSRESFTQPFSQPEKFQESSYYPTTYNVYFKNGKHYITLSDFVWRDAD